MTIFPLKSEGIAFEQRCLLADPVTMHRSSGSKCHDRRADCDKRKWYARIAAALFGLALSACAHPPAAPPAMTMIAGGWQAADPASEAVQDAAKYALTQLPAGHGALAKVRTAQMQVVAGINFRMVLQLSDGTIFEAMVWRKLDGSYALTGMPPKP